MSKELSKGKVEVIDHGYVELIESWGSDERIIEAARMSTGKGFQGWRGDLMFDCLEHGLLEGDYRKGDIATNGADAICIKCLDSGRNSRPLIATERKSGDEKLLRYLYTHKHMTPFEMCGLTVEIQAPIFVFREWHRHRTQSYNEMSARYIPLPDVSYLPTIYRMMIDAGSNKQAQGLAKLDSQSAERFEHALSSLYAESERVYQLGLSLGVPKELARCAVTVARYSRMRASANLRNWLQFLTLRMAPNAQWEIRQYANVVGEIISRLFPRTWELFVEGANK